MESHPLYGTAGQSCGRQTLDVHVNFTSKKIAVLYIPTTIEVEIDTDKDAKGNFQLANLGENTLSWKVLSIAPNTGSGSSSKQLNDIITFKSNFMQYQHIASATGETAEVEFNVNASNIPSADYAGHILVNASFGAAPFPVNIPMRVAVKPGATDFTRCDVAFSSVTSGMVKITDHGAVALQNLTVQVGIETINSRSN